MRSEDKDEFVTFNTFVLNLFKWRRVCDDEKMLCWQSNRLWQSFIKFFEPRHVLNSHLSHLPHKQLDTISSKEIYGRLTFKESKCKYIIGQPCGDKMSLWHFNLVVFVGANSSVSGLWWVWEWERVCVN